MCERNRSNWLVWRWLGAGNVWERKVPWKSSFDKSKRGSSLFPAKVIWDSQAQRIEHEEGAIFYKLVYHIQLNYQRWFKKEENGFRNIKHRH